MLNFTLEVLASGKCNCLFTDEIDEMLIYAENYKKSTKNTKPKTKTQ
jgi:hypothetical protein